ncbi:probable WRKY transcription factor 45 isoform X2 [Prosopis cineraria]|uniref:probable WRKY transcription factor 45 isoform X2 n=1 Tax=Prosopis cineraria TaxID=364024 RepID=UPI0024106134|nr:probable WRKY transcription factor 45 isoform X2 [Prosopis cineraria]
MAIDGGNINQEVIHGSPTRSYYKRAQGGCSDRNRLLQSTEDMTIVEINPQGTHTFTQASRVSDSSMNNQLQLDLMTQFGVDIDINSHKGGIFSDQDRYICKQKSRSRWRVLKHCIKFVRILSDTANKIKIDGYRWGKYNQEVIPGSPTPSNYYKSVQGDSSDRKQLRQPTEDPTIVEITHERRHTFTQASCVTDSFMNNQLELMTQFGIFDMNDLTGKSDTLSAITSFTSLNMLN